MTTGTTLLSRKETAALLGIRTQTLATWAVTGRYDLPMIHVGRSVRYRLADLERWLESRTVDVAAASGEDGRD
jgi:excisionase family DNA binding protein